MLRVSRCSPTRRYFGGAVADLDAARAAVDVPVLRKDFTIDEVQVFETRAVGADAILLIAAALPDDAHLTDLHALATELGLGVLVETHDDAELERALRAGARVVGVNARDLGTFDEDLSIGERLAKVIPPEVIAVAESAIRSTADAARMADAGFDAVLVGEMLVRADRPDRVRARIGVGAAPDAVVGRRAMDTVILGRTGVEVSVAGLGCGGHSRLGQSYGASTAASVDLVRRALDLGITYVDTAQGYGTEGIVGEAVAGRRDGVVISSKASPRSRDGVVLDAAGLRAAVERSLAALDTDCVDVYHLHGVGDDEYDHCVDELVPELLRLRDAGAIRFLAISERFAADPGHVMLQRAVADDCWDVMMVGFNLLNQSARDRVFTATRELDVAVEVMFAVRRALSRDDELARVVQELVAEGHLDAGDVDLDEPLEFLVHDAGASSVVEAAYRFTRHEPGCHVVLTGTGNVEHLEENVRSICAPALPADDLARLRNVFGHLDHLSGN